MNKAIRKMTKGNRKISLCLNVNDVYTSINIDIYNQVLQKFTFTKKMVEVQIPQKFAPCAHSLKLAGKPFYYHHISQTFQGMSTLSFVESEIHFW